MQERSSSLRADHMAVLMPTPLRRSSRLRNKGESCKTLPPTSRALKQRPDQDDEKLTKPIPDPIPKQEQVVPRKRQQLEQATATTRKRRRREEDSGPGPTRKRPRAAAEAAAAAAAIENTIHVPSGDLRPISERSDCQPIIHWTITGQWPANFLTMDAGSGSFKPPERSASYTDLSKQGKVPKSDSAASEAHLASHGIFTDEIKGDMFVSEDSKKLCEEMCNAQFEDPAYTQFPLSSFLLIWNRLRTRNEFRVNRDLTPLLVPSPENLFFCGHQELEHIAEEVCADFTKSNPLAGPRPRPDLSIGIAPSAFTDEEIAKLQNHSSPDRATLFTDNIYFPFLLCETKCGNQVISKADRQNIRSSSMAVNAIIQLYQVLGENQTSKLSSQTLVISISHTDEQVKIYGHYAVISGAQVAFYRHRIDSFYLGPGGNMGNRKKTYNFVREVYKSFYPAHLKRIQDALKQMKDPRAQSMPASMMSVEPSSSGAPGSSVPSSEQTTATNQSTPVFKKPGVPAGKKRKGKQAQQDDWLKEQLQALREEKAQQEARYAEEKARQEKLYAELQMLYEKQEKRYEERERRYAEEKVQQARQMEMLQQVLNQVNRASGGRG